jgi:diguanylate cyclase (GGDEF)-like protein/PAS domain S-box-containing protein
MRQRPQATSNHHWADDMKSADREGFEEALKECANERIHQIGHIQPHGATLVFDTDAWHTVRQASENLADFLDLPNGTAVGQPLAALLGEPATTQALNLVRVAGKKQTGTGILPLVHNGVPVQLQAHLYAAGGQWALELERDDGTHQETQLAQLQLQFQQTLLEFDSDADLTQYLNETAKLVRKLTGYDSVMVYRFNERWDGEIIAQDRIEAAPSYLGQHFPASDIPPQARRLYATNLVRIVVNVNAQPVPILPVLNEGTGEPLDMTYSALRSLSPIHLEYLRNIGVSASMVISLMQDGQLWGMVACHHMTPRRVSIAMRESAIFISRMISAKLSGIAALEQRAKVNQANSLVNELVKSIATDDESVTLQKLLPRLLQVIDATGVIVVIDGQPHGHGTVPDMESVRALLDWLGNRLTTGELFVTDELGQQFPPALSYVDVASGLLATALSRDIRSGIVWLRPEKPRTVNWAGNYQTGLKQNAAGNFRLTPRKSFEIWCETWQGRSDPWSRADTGIAAMLSLSVPEALNKKSKLEAEQARFRQAHLTSEKTVQQFNKLTAAVPGVVYQFLATPTGGWMFLYLSKGVEDLYEVIAEDAYLDHRVMTNLIVLEDRTSHREAVEHSATSLSAWVHEHRIKTSSGKLKWVRGEAIPQRQEDGSVLWNGILTDITERRQIDEVLRRNQVMLARTERIARIGSWEWDVVTDTVLWSNELFRVFQIDPASGAPSFAQHNTLYFPEDMQRLSDAVAVALNSGSSYELELRAIRKDGAIRVCLASGVAEIGVDNKVTRLFGSLQDITERKQAELELLRSKNRYQGILNNMKDAYWRVDNNGRIVEVNPAICQMSGYSREELLRMSIADVEVIESAEDTRKRIETIMREGFDAFESQHRCKDGRIIDVEISASKGYDSPGDIDAFHRDITERKQMERHIRELAFYDTLTELPNRRLLSDRVTQAMAVNKRSGSYGALMFLDLDNFKPLNDKHGHEAGDMLLIEAADRLKACVREMDTVARFGGDEFVVMISELVADKNESTEQAKNVAEKIRIALSEPYLLATKHDRIGNTTITHHCTASIGVALFANHDSSPDEVLKWADAAMYQAKQDGRNTIRFYDRSRPPPNSALDG